MPTIGDFTTASSMSTRRGRRDRRAAADDRRGRGAPAARRGTARRPRPATAATTRAGGVLADLQPQALVFDFEFGELVLAHEIENLFELVEVH